MSLNIFYYWNGKRHCVYYKVANPEWREHFQMLIEAGKKPRIFYNV